MAGPYEQNYFALNNFRERFLRPKLRPAQYYNVNGSLMPRKISETLGYGVHRSGWSRCVDQISRCELPVLVDDFVERTFMARQANQVHRRRFVGVFHYPPDADLPRFAPANSDIRHSVIFSTAAWKLSEANMVAGICLSEHLAASLRRKFDIPFHVVQHPTETDVRHWDVDSFLERPTIVQVGAFYRDTRSITRIAAEGFLKMRILDLRYDWINQWDKLVGRTLGPAVLPEDIIHFNRVDDALYDELLSSCILHTNYLAASASNVIVEAIARNTPCIVNRHPAVVEYLGDRYPLYEDELRSSDELVDRARAANDYLMKIDKHQFSYDTFQSRLSTLFGGTTARGSRSATQAGGPID